MNHCDEMTALLYLEGQLDAVHTEAIAAHAASCAGCQKLLHALTGENVWLREAFTAQTEAIPPSLVHVPAGAETPWGWVAVLGFAAGGAYTLWSSFIAPWLAQAAQAGFSPSNLLVTFLFSGAFWEGWDTMLNLIEFLAAATLGLTALWLLARYSRRSTATAVVISALLCILLLPRSAGAAEIRRGNPNYTLPAGQEIKTDLIVAAQRTRIDGDVDGDLIVWSRSITVNGRVRGDVIAFGQEVHVNGPVDGNVRAFAQSLTLTGLVQKNVMSWAQEVDADEKAKVEGTMTLGAGNVQLDGQVVGDILGFANEFDVNGSLNHNVEIRASRLIVGPGAAIGGHITYRGARQPEISPQAKLSSPIEVGLSRAGSERTSSPPYYWRQALYWGASFLFGTVLFLLAPGFFTDVARSSKKVGPAMGLGFLLLFATPFAALIACFTIVGLGVGIGAFFLYVIALYSAQVFVGSWLGERFLGEAVGAGPNLGRLALGLALLRAMRIVPFAGPVITFLVLIWGLGAIALTFYKKMRPPFAPAT